MADYNFRAPSLPIPPIAYDQNQQNQFESALRLYFNRLDTFQANEAKINNSQNVMIWLGGFGGGC